ncbi:MAG: hypothetical protein ACLRSW_06360 [Christensenellaceae bacterium]
MPTYAPQTTTTQGEHDVQPERVHKLVQLRYDAAQIFIERSSQKFIRFLRFLIISFRFIFRFFAISTAMPHAANTPSSTK